MRFYLRSCIGQETAKNLPVFRVKPPPAQCPSVYHTPRRLHTVPSNAKRQAGELWISIFLVVGLAPPGIQARSIVLVATRDY